MSAEVGLDNPRRRRQISRIEHLRESVGGGLHRLADKLGTPSVTEKLLELPPHSQERRDLYRQHRFDVISSAVYQTSMGPELMPSTTMSSVSTIQAVQESQRLSKMVEAEVDSEIHKYIVEHI